MTRAPENASPHINLQLCAPPAPNSSVAPPEFFNLFGISQIKSASDFIIIEMGLTCQRKACFKKLKCAWTKRLWELKCKSESQASFGFAPII